MPGSSGQFPARPIGGQLARSVLPAGGISKGIAPHSNEGGPQPLKSKGFSQFLSPGVTIIVFFGRESRAIFIGQTAALFFKLLLLNELLKLSKDLGVFGI
ncbi:MULTISPECIES: hypothetical protein [unclassified Nitrospina]|uniref:hypothetical protein n=1 Tax=unclassified Nitrospina TaxID=2638683 RepID=UPI003F968C40